MNEFSHKKIRSEKTVGEKLEQARKRMGYNLEFVEKETKVSLRYLQALEHDCYEKLPPDVYVIGFLRRYGEFLNLDTQELISHYQEEKQLACSLRPLKKSISASNIIKLNPEERLLKTPGFVITPRVILSSLIIVLVISILSYIWYQVKGFAAAPPLDLNNLDSSEQIVQVESVVITGQTDPGASLFISGQLVAVGPDGHFTQIVQLASGINEIEIIARNKADKETKKIIRLLAEY